MTNQALSVQSVNPNRSLPKQGAAYKYRMKSILGRVHLVRRVRGKFGHFVSAWLSLIHILGLVPVIFNYFRMQKSSNSGYNLEGVTVAKVNGEDIPVLVSNLNEGQRSVIVSEKVFGYLLDLLPKAKLRDIKEQFIASVSGAKDMPEYLEVIKEELEFHANVNTARQYYNMEALEISDEPQVVS